MIADIIKSLYDKQGYVIVPSLIPTELDKPVLEATERAIARTRSGEWPHRRTVGKQFPPFDNANPDSWGVQHLMHPDLGEPIFAEWYTSGPLVQTICRLLDCDEDKLQMGVLGNQLGMLSEFDYCRSRIVQSVDKPRIPRIRLAVAPRRCTRDSF